MRTPSPDPGETLRAAVVGSGLLGSRRALDLLSLEKTCVAAIVGPAEEQGRALARRLQEIQRQPCDWLPDITPLLDAQRLDLALVAVPHDVAAPIVAALLDAGIDTLIEKPMGLNLPQAEALARAAERSTARLAVGFNYRHYSGIVRARQLLLAGAIGRPLFIRMILGHGGRPGYEMEWKLSQQHCGGGVLMDPGIHLLDLSRFFLGELQVVQSHCARLFWDADVEDSVAAVLRSEQGAEVYLQTSIVEWQNHFSVHLFGQLGYLKVDGRMGNYGPQRLIHGRRWAWLEHQSQAAGDTVESFSDEDSSYRDELRLVVDAFRSGTPLPADHHDGLAAMKLVSELYERAGPISVSSR